MPSTKVFAAVLAALAMPMVNAGPCKPVKPVTTSGSTDAIITTTGLTTGGTEAATGTTEIVATTTAAAACTHFTPLVPQPADCGKKGFASNDEGKTIGLPIIAETSADCGNKCGMTVGCKSFSHIATTCSLFKVPVSELGFVESQQSMTALFYDLENCFGCGDEPGATSGAETATSGTETATSGTETAATGSPTETSATSGAQADTTTATAAGTTDTAVTTTAAATTTTDAACTAYTLVPNAPATNCAKKGKAITPQIIQTETVEDLDACSLKCGNYVNDLLPSVVCRSFSFKASTNSCTLYKVKISDMNVVSCSITDEQDFYDFDVCYSCQEGGASTTEAATTTAQSAATTETAGTTTETGSGFATTTVAGTTTAAESDSATTTAAGTTTAAESTGTTTAAESTGTTTAAESTGTTTAAESVGTTTTAEAAGTTTTADAGVSTTAAETTTAQSTTEGITTTTEGITTTTEAATTTAEPTTTTAAPVCTNYIIKPNAPSSCGKQGKVSCRSNQKLGQPSTSESSAACGKTCGNTDGCKAFSWTYKLRSQSTCQLYSAPLSELSFTPCNTGTKFYDLDTCFTCSNTPTPNPPTPNPPATCSKYVPTFETCSKDTHCGTRGEICNETRIYTTVDNSCLENCAKSCIQYGAECKYFSYKAADMFGAAKCKLYKAGKITYKSYSSTKFYEQKCFKCKETLAVKKAT
ncbi:uncharacterized protein QYS62_006260 [Fusarium acuminatum]|uniref:Apple domain-containing protein n=1 Tax=Fusarium acuminatum TaxID=5515 RepID=A0ABZ2WZN3_9HYPO